MELDRRNIELAALAIIVLVFFIRIDPDWMGRIANILMTVNPFITALIYVAASALFYGATHSEVITYVTNRIKGAMDTVMIKDSFAQKGDILIAKGGRCLECFALFELKGIHVAALRQPNAALVSTLHSRGIVGSIDMITEGEKDPRIFYCIKARGGLAKDEDALVAETEVKAQAFRSTIETVYEGLLNLERVEGPDLIDSISFISYDGSGPVYRVEQQEEGPIPQPHLEKFLRGAGDGRVWISIIYEPWKIRGISLDAIRLWLKRSNIKGEYRRAVKKAGVRVMDPNLAWGRSTNTLNADIGEELRARALQANYEMYERGRRIGLWRLQVRAVILGEGAHKATLRSMKAISALQASLLRQEPIDEGEGEGEDEEKEMPLIVVEAKNAERELRNIVLRRVDCKPLVATSSDLAYYFQPQCVGSLYLVPNTPRPSPTTFTRMHDDDVVLGRVLTSSEELGTEFSLGLESLKKHTVILGSTGSGKSTTAKILAHELSMREMATLILDWTGEFKEALSNANGNVAMLVPGQNFTLNLFETSDREEDAVDWVDTMDYYAQAAWGAPLTPLQRRILMEILDRMAKEVEVITFTQLLDGLKEVERREARRTDWTQSVEALISRLQPLTLGRNRRVFDQPKTTLNTEEIFEATTTVVDLSALGGDEAKTLLSQLLCKKIYDFVGGNSERTDKTRLVLIVDEAQHLAPQLTGVETTAKLGIMERYALELRKYGIGLVTIASRPALLSKNIIANANTLICHKLFWQEDVDRIADTLGLVDPNTWEHDEAYKQCLRTLAPGQALVKLDDHAIKFPFLVRVGLERHGPLIRCQEAEGTRTPSPDASLVIPKMSRILEIALLRLSENVVMTRRELGLSQRQAQELVDLNMVGQDRYDCLRITEKGRNIVEAISKRDGS